MYGFCGRRIEAGYNGDGLPLPSSVGSPAGAAPQGWWLESSEGFLTHLTGTWCRLLAGGLSSSPCGSLPGLLWSSSQHDASVSRASILKATSQAELCPLDSLSSKVTLDHLHGEESQPLPYSGGENIELPSQRELVQTTLEEHVGWQILLPSFRNSPASVALHYKPGIKPKFHVICPCHMSTLLFPEKPLGPAFWFSNTSRSWSTQSLQQALPLSGTVFVPLVQGWLLLFKFKIKDYPSKSSSLATLNRLLYSLLPHPLHFFYWPIPLWDYVLISWLSMCKIYAYFIKNIFPLPSTVPGTQYSPNSSVWGAEINAMRYLSQRGRLRAGF